MSAIWANRDAFWIYKCILESSDCQNDACMYICVFFCIAKGNKCPLSLSKCQISDQHLSTCCCDIYAHTYTHISQQADCILNTKKQLMYSVLCIIFMWQDGFSFIFSKICFNLCSISCFYKCAVHINAFGILSPVKTVIFWYKWRFSPLWHTHSLIQLYWLLSWKALGSWVGCISVNSLWQFIMSTSDSDTMN